LIWQPVSKSCKQVNSADHSILLQENSKSASK
jgi:hypothetical protein